MTKPGPPRKIPGNDDFKQKDKKFEKIDEALTMLLVNQDNSKGDVNLKSLEAKELFFPMVKAFQNMNGKKRGPLMNENCGGDKSLLGCLQQVCFTLSYPNWQPDQMLLFIITWLSYSQLLKTPLLQLATAWMEKGAFREELLFKSKKSNNSTSESNLVIIISHHLASMQGINFYLGTDSVMGKWEKQQQRLPIH